MMAHPIPRTPAETEREVLEVIGRVCGEIQQIIADGEYGQPLQVKRDFLKTLFGRLDLIRKTVRQKPNY